MAPAKPALELGLADRLLETRMGTGCNPPPARAGMMMMRQGRFPPLPPGDYCDSSNTRSAPPSAVAAIICRPVSPKKGGMLWVRPETTPTYCLPSIM
jgi:hypothetical protein